MAAPNQPLVTITSTEVKVSARDTAEARLALKELKLKKKEVALQKKRVMADMKAIRASYTDEVRRRGSMMRGGGGAGKVVRLFQTGSRDARRRQLATDLAPLETEKQRLESMTTTIEGILVKLEQYILSNP